LPALADKRSKQCRATAYRLIRHLLVDPESVHKLIDQNIDWFLVRSLIRDSKFAVEKEQVIKLIRTIVEIGSARRGGGPPGKIPLSDTVMRAFIAVAEHVEEPFRPVCIQTLAEIRECNRAVLVVLMKLNYPQYCWTLTWWPARVVSDFYCIVWATVQQTLRQYWLLLSYT
jgi:hypothetical protein